MRVGVLAAAFVVAGCANRLEPARLAAPIAPAKPKVTLTLSLKPIARMWFHVGMAHLANGEFADGIDALKRAYEVLPHRNVAYNIARAYAEAGSFADAIAWYRVYLASNPPDAAEVAEVVRSIEKHVERRRERFSW